MVLEYPPPDYPPQYPPPPFPPPSAPEAVPRAETYATPRTGTSYLRAISLLLLAAIVARRVAR
jgi:hypothetical protein